MLAPLGAVFPLNHRISICPFGHNIYLKFPPASKANPLAAPCPNTTLAAWSNFGPHHLAVVSPAPGGDRQELGCILAQLHLSGALLQISEGKEDRTSSWGKGDSCQSLDQPKSTKHSPAETKPSFLLPLQKETFSDALEGISSAALFVCVLPFLQFFWLWSKSQTWGEHLQQCTTHKAQAGRSCWVSQAILDADGAPQRASQRSLWETSKKADMLPSASDFCLNNWHPLKCKALSLPKPSLPTQSLWAFSPMISTSIFTQAFKRKRWHLQLGLFQKCLAAAAPGYPLETKTHLVKTYLLRITVYLKVCYFRFQYVITSNIISVVTVISLDKGACPCRTRMYNQQ